MSDPIRVLHVLGHLVRGGAETMVMNLYRNIDRSRIQFDFVVHTNEKNDYDDEIEKMGGKIHRVPRYNGKNHFIYKNSWKTIFNENPEYKIIHGHVRSTASIYLGVANEFNLITISHSHSISNGRGISGLVKKILQYPIRYKADYLFSCSDEAGQWLYGKKSTKKQNYYIMKNAIDVDQYVYDESKRIKTRENLGVENNFVIGHVGRLTRAKNHKFIMKIFKKIVEHRDDAILLLIGDGELRGELEQLVIDIGLVDHVIFTGTRDDIPNLLQSMDVFLFPSLYEGLGISAIEAQAAGLPTIVSNRIPQETHITDLIKAINLNSSLETWTNNIFEYTKRNKRQDYSQEIKKNGYDIFQITEWLQQFYIKLEKNKHNLYKL